MENLAHALVQCQGNNGVGNRVMECIREFVPNLEVESALRLELDVEEEMELPLVWMIATAFLAIWSLRIVKAKVQLYDIRAQLEAKINLLRETRHANSAQMLDQLVAKYLQ